MNSNYPPSSIISFLNRVKINNANEFYADIDLNFNGRRMRYESKVKIAIFENYFELFLPGEGPSQQLPERLDSRSDIFWNESPDSVTVARITEACSYKATIFPKQV